MWPHLSLSGILKSLGMNASGSSDSTLSVENALLEEIQRARREWQMAQRYFHSVCEPELVDHAIFNLEAAQRKYMYLTGRMRSLRNGPNREV